MQAIYMVLHTRIVIRVLNIHPLYARPCSLDNWVRFILYSLDNLVMGFRARVWFVGFGAY